MKKLAIMVIALALLTGFAVADDLNLCPFFDQEITPEEFVTTGNTVSISGICSGSMSVRSSNVYQAAGGTVSSNNFGLSASHGDTALIYSTSIAGTGPTSTTSGERILEFSGNGASMEDNFYMSRITDETPGCEQAIGGTSLMFTSGSFGSTLNANVAPEIGIELLYQFAAGPGSAASSEGLAGTVRTAYNTNQIYGEYVNGTATPQYSSDISTRSRWTGITTVAGEYSFSTVSG